MLAYHLLSALALLQLSTTSVHADPVETCQQQLPCLTFEVTKEAPVCDLEGTCSFKACITLNTNNAGCVKNGEEISHLCDQSGVDYCPNDGDEDGEAEWDVDEQEGDDETVDLANDYEQCQIGAAGDTLLFVYKDGGGQGGLGCSDVAMPMLPQIYPPLLTDDGLGQVSCRSRSSLDGNTCTGNGNNGKECIWTIELPPSCDGTCVEDGDCTESGTRCCLDTGYCLPILVWDLAACGDPHMTGFLGQKFDFTGEDSGWYCLIKDDNMQVNMRVTSPVPSLPEITYITGLSVLTTGVDGSEHDLVIEVKDPHNLDSSCPAGISPCLADGSLSVILDGQETLLAPGTVGVGQDVEVSAANLPGACRSFGFEKYWEQKKLEYAIADGRRLSEKLSMGEWILADPTATNMDECIDHVARAETEEGGVFAHQSEHASFQIVTPKATIRLSHGKLHQIAMRDPTDQYDLPDHLTWQMNVAVDHTEVNHDAKGVLGETFVPTRDANGEPIMTGMEAIRGKQEDYRVEEALGRYFVQDAHTS